MFVYRRVLLKAFQQSCTFCQGIDENIQMIFCFWLSDSCDHVTRKRLLSKFCIWNKKKSNGHFTALQSAMPRVTQVTPGIYFMLEVKKTKLEHHWDMYIFFYSQLFGSDLQKYLPQHIFSMSHGLWEKLWLSKFNSGAEMVVCLD